MNIIKKNVIKSNLYELELELKKQKLKLQENIELLSGYHPSDIVNELVIEGVSYQLLKLLTKDEYVYERDDKKILHARKTEKHLIKIIPLTDDEKEKKIIRQLDDNYDNAFVYKCHNFKTNNFKLVRRSDHLSLCNGNITITPNGKIIDTFKETRKKI